MDSGGFETVAPLVPLEYALRWFFYQGKFYICYDILLI